MQGEVGSVPIENLSKALRGGAEIVSPQEYEQADLQARYGDLKHQALALGTEALDTATLGASNAVIGGLGGKDVRETIRKSQEANPVSTGLGTAAGIIAPVVADVATGGAATPVVAGALERVGEKALVRAGEKALVEAGEHAAARELGQAGRVVLGDVATHEAPAAQRAIQFGERARPVGLNNPALEGEFASGHAGPRQIGLTARAEPNVPLRGEIQPQDLFTERAGLPPVEQPFRIGQPTVADLFTENAPRHVGLRAPTTADIFSEGALAADAEAAPLRIEPTINPNAGLEGDLAARNPIQIGRAKNAPVPVRLGDVEQKAAGEIRKAIEIHAPETPPIVADAAAKVAATDAEAGARVYGKGVIRQAVETSLLGPQRLVTGAGQAVEDAVSRIVGKEAETALGRVAQKAVASAARGAVEGGAYNVGSEIGHQFLQDDPELNGERLASAWFNGALLGGAFGGGLGVLSQGSKEALNRVVGKEGVAAYLSEKAGEHMWHAAGPTKRMTAEAERYAGGVAKVGNFIRQDAVELLGKTPSTREELVQLAGLMQEKHTKGLDNVIDRLDSSGLKGERPKVGDILKDVDKVIAELRERAAPTGQLEGLRNRIIDAADARNPLTGEINLNKQVTFRQLRDFRVSVDEMAPWNAPVGSDTAPRSAVKQLRSMFEKRLTDITEPLANDAGGSLLKDYRHAKAGYQAGKLLEKAASSGVSAQKTNMFHSLTDKLLEIPGAMIGHAAAGPIGGLAVGLATAQASKFIRRNFDFVVSDVLAKLADVSRGEHVLNAAQKSAERVQRREEQGLNAVKRALNGEEVAPHVHATSPKTFEERRATLLNVAAQTDVVEGHIKDVTGTLDRAAPDVSSRFKSASLRTLTYLMDALPKPPPPPKNSLTPQLESRTWKPSDQQMAAFNRKYDMAVHPETALALVAAGQYTIQHDQALNATNPKMKAQMQKKLEKELSLRTKPVPVGMRASTRLFLGVPQVDPSLGKMLQANYAPAPPPPALHKPLKLDDTTTLNKPRF